MRENLFRGRKEGSPEWVYGYLAAYDLISPRYPENVSNALGEYYGETPYVGFVEVDPDTVGQYAWLTDKNRKKIFEGDILSVQDGDIEQYRFVVVFGRCGGVENTDHEVGYMGFYLVPGNKKTEQFCKHGLRNDIVFFLNSDFDAVVVGNIWDNPELLEVNGEDA